MNIEIHDTECKKNQVYINHIKCKSTKSVNQAGLVAKLLNFAHPNCYKTV